MRKLRILRRAFLTVYKNPNGEMGIRTPLFGIAWGPVYGRKKQITFLFVPNFHSALRGAGYWPTRGALFTHSFCCEYEGGWRREIDKSYSFLNRLRSRIKGAVA